MAVEDGINGSFVARTFCLVDIGWGKWYRFVEAWKRVIRLRRIGFRWDINCERGRARQSLGKMFSWTPRTFRRI